MADQRLRSVEREVLAGEPGAPARLLRERLRAGAVDLERVRLAAWLGDGDARDALGADAWAAFAGPLLAETRAEPEDRRSPTPVGAESIPHRSEHSPARGADGGSSERA